MYDMTSVITSLLGVIVGFGLGLIKEKIQQNKELKEKKSKVIRRINYVCEMYSNYAFMLYECISTTNYYKQRNIFVNSNLIDDELIPISFIESWRKDYEGYKLKLIELDATLSELLTEFQVLDGVNNKIKALRRQISVMGKAHILEFNTVESIKEYNEQLIYHQISQGIQEQDGIANLLKQLQDLFINYNKNRW